MDSEATSALLRRHPYLVAEKCYSTGRMHSATAIGLVARDRGFIAEAELRGIDVIEAARKVVLEKWRARLVKGEMV